MIALNLEELVKTLAMINNKESFYDIIMWNQGSNDAT